MVTTWAMANLDLNASFTAADGNQLWSLQSLLMQVEHPTANTCTFFQAIDNSTGNGIVFTMLPSAAAYGCNTILGIIPFTHWLLGPVYGKHQSHNLDTTFHSGALQEVAMANWDQENNCVQQKEGDLLGRALNDLDIYNLRSKHNGKPQATVLVNTTGTVLQASTTAENMAQAQQAGQANQLPSHNATQDNDSLTNSIQLQTTMFTQAIHQMDALAECQVAFKNNTQSALETVMQQLAEIN